MSLWLWTATCSWNTPGQHHLVPLTLTPNDALLLCGLQAWMTTTCCHVDINGLNCGPGGFDKGCHKSPETTPEAGHGAGTQAQASHPAPCSLTVPPHFCMAQYRGLCQYHKMGVYIMGGEGSKRESLQYISPHNFLVGGSKAERACRCLFSLLHD